MMIYKILLFFFYFSFDSILVTLFCLTVWMAFLMSSWGSYLSFFTRPKKTRQTIVHLKMVYTFIIVYISVKL